jgi:hypothetical protein
MAMTRTAWTHLIKQSALSYSNRYDQGLKQTKFARLPWKHGRTDRIKNIQLNLLNARLGAIFVISDIEPPNRIWLLVYSRAKNILAMPYPTEN